MGQLRWGARQSLEMSRAYVSSGTPTFTAMYRNGRVVSFRQCSFLLLSSPCNLSAHPHLPQPTAARMLATTTLFRVRSVAQTLAFAAFFCVAQWQQRHM